MRYLILNQHWPREMLVPGKKKSKISSFSLSLVYLKIWYSITHLKTENVLPYLIFNITRELFFFFRVKNMQGAPTLFLFLMRHNVGGKI